jgi:hypothetical protein
VDTTRRKVRPVRLHGRTRLTYHQAVALLRAAIYGEVAMTADDSDQDSLRAAPYVRRAILKLKKALDQSGGYDDAGHLYDPFE